jgi:hypothetical protein
LVDIQEELRKLQLEAIKRYNDQQYDDAEALFSEMLEVLKTIYPANHPECVKAEKSIIMVQRRRVAADKSTRNIR